MTWYYVKFPDAGAGRTRIVSHIEADSEEAARELAKSHEHFSGYDPSKGTVKETNLTRSEVEERVMDVTSPNTAITRDGTRLQRNSEKGRIDEY